MADKSLLDDRKIISIVKATHLRGGWNVKLSCGHEFWSPTEISKNLLMTCYVCVRKYAFDARQS